LSTSSLVRRCSGWRGRTRATPAACVGHGATAATLQPPGVQVDELHQQPCLAQPVWDTEPHLPRCGPLEFNSRSYTSSLCGTRSHTCNAAASWSSSRRATPAALPRCGRLQEFMSTSYTSSLWGPRSHTCHTAASWNSSRPAIIFFISST